MSTKKLAVSTATAQGPREHQEDRELVAGHPDSPEGLLLAAFDGHGGASTAQFAVENLRSVFLQQAEHPVAERIGFSLFELGRMTQNMRSGATASAIHVTKDFAHVAFMGDSPVIIIDDKGNMVVSDVHNVYSNKRERDEACERGGNYRGLYIYGPTGSGLQLTRSLGDSKMGRIIKREPELYSVKLGPKSVIIVCSDGVLDLSHSPNEKLLDRMVRVAQTGAHAKEILDMARPFNDNATVIVYKHQ